MPRLYAGGSLAVEAWDRDNKTKLATGVLVATDNQIGTTTGTVKLRAEFKNEDYLLFPNQFVNARALIDVRHGATVIPRPPSRWARLDRSCTWRSPTRPSRCAR